MSQPAPLMPHATASWLVDNTALSFEQIAEFCGLHILEVQAMADDLASSKYTGRDPVRSGELTMAEIEKGQADASYALQMQKAPVNVNRTKGPPESPIVRSTGTAAKARAGVLSTDIPIGPPVRIAHTSRPMSSRAATATASKGRNGRSGR